MLNMISSSWETIALLFKIHMEMSLIRKHNLLLIGGICKISSVILLSWTFEKEGTKLEWRWKCQPSLDSKKTTAEVLDFLMDANIKLSEEVVWKTQSFDRLKQEAEKCLAQSEKLNSEKSEFESEIYGKFVSVLNSKKAKLRELRDRLSKQGTSHQLPEQKEEESTDRTESFDGESDNDEENKRSG